MSELNDQIALLEAETFEVIDSTPSEDFAGSTSTSSSTSSTTCSCSCSSCCSTTSSSCSSTSSCA